MIEQEIYYIHRRHLSRLKLTPAAEVDRTETRLAFYSQPQLARFFEPLFRVRDDIRWVNERELPEEAREFSRALDSVEREATDNRDLLLHALAQLVAGGNLGKLLDATRKPFYQSFMAFARAGSYEAAKAKEVFGYGFYKRWGFLSLGRMMNGEPVPVYVLPDAVRQALGAMTSENVSSSPASAASEAKDGALPAEKAKPGVERIVAMSLKELPRAWSMGRFLLAQGGVQTATELKRFASMAKFPVIPGGVGMGARKPTPASKIFIQSMEIALKWEARHRIERKPFPEVLRSFIAGIEQGDGFFLLATECARHLSAPLYLISHSELTTFGKLIFDRLRASTVDSWEKVARIIDAVEESKPRLRILTGMSMTAYNTYRSNRYDVYGRSSLNERKDVKEPYARVLLTACALLGIVDLGLDNEPALGDTRYSQFDSVREVKLTALGAYALGATSTPPEDVERYDIPLCRLDDEYPFIYVPEEVADLYAPYLRKVGKPIGATRYAVSAETFMQGVVSRRMLEARIKQFREFVGQELPEVWQALLERIKRRAYSLSGGDVMYASLKIDRDNDELIDFVLHNETISKDCIRGEGGVLFVPVHIFSDILDTFIAAGFLPQ